MCTLFPFFCSVLIAIRVGEGVRGEGLAFTVTVNVMVEAVGLGLWCSWMVVVKGPFRDQRDPRSQIEWDDTFTFLMVARFAPAFSYSFSNVTTSVPAAQFELSLRKSARCAS